MKSCFVLNLNRYKFIVVINLLAAYYTIQYRSSFEIYIPDDGHVWRKLVVFMPEKFIEHSTLCVCVWGGEGG
jgi:hypothetical protein